MKMNFSCLGWRSSGAASLCTRYLNRVENGICKTVCVLGLGAMLHACSVPEKATPQPTKGQQAMIDRKYGMFLHFGMNTYLNAEWSDGTAPASTYAPPADIAEKAAGWVRNAKRAGMRSIVLTTKHHDGFCLWDSRYTEHDIANPAIENKVDIVKAVSDACQKEGVAFSIYYSLWDRHEPSYQDSDKRAYIRMNIQQSDGNPTVYSIRLK